jgi:hypothetical protein
MMFIGSEFIIFRGFSQINRNSVTCKEAIPTTVQKISPSTTGHRCQATIEHHWPDSFQKAPIGLISDGRSMIVAERIPVQRQSPAIEGNFASNQDRWDPDICGLQRTSGFPRVFLSPRLESRMAPDSLS